MSFNYLEHFMHQYEIPLMAVLNGPTKAPESVVASFSSTSDAIKWSYENRTHSAAKSVAWQRINAAAAEVVNSAIKARFAA